MLRRDGDKSMLMAPLVYHGRTIGLLEVVDQKRTRHYTRQELRLCRAVAGQAAAALHNAKLFAEQRRSDEDIARLRTSLVTLRTTLPGLVRAGGGDRQRLLGELARAACAAIGAISCVASMGDDSAGAFGERRGERRRSARTGEPGRRARPVRRQRSRARRHAGGAARRGADRTARPPGRRRSRAGHRRRRQDARTRSGPRVSPVPSRARSRARASQVSTLERRGSLEPRPYACRSDLDSVACRSCSHARSSPNFAGLCAELPSFDCRRAIGSVAACT